MGIKKIVVFLLILLGVPVLGRAEEHPEGDTETALFEKNVRELIEKNKVDPKQTALLVVAMQNEFLSTAGGYARQGNGTSTPKPEKHQVLPRFKNEVENLRRLLDVARKMGVLIIYSKYITEDESGILLLDGPVLWRFHNKKWMPRTAEGSWGAKIIDELKPGPEDIVIRHSSENAFLNTSLKHILKNRAGIDDVKGDRPVATVLIAGLNLGGGLDPAIMTGYGAASSGVSFNPVIDCLCRKRRLSQNFWVDHNWLPYRSKEIIAAWDGMQK